MNEFDFVLKNVYFISQFLEIFIIIIITIIIIIIIINVVVVVAVILFPIEIIFVVCFDSYF